MKKAMETRLLSPSIWQDNNQVHQITKKNNKTVNITNQRKQYPINELNRKFPFMKKIAKKVHKEVNFKEDILEGFMLKTL